jgi:hypothetical protein
MIPQCLGGTGINAGGWVALIAFAALFAFIAYRALREGRNEVLEQQVMTGQLGSLDTFSGTLDVQEYKPGTYLKLAASSPQARRLQFWYRWVSGIGPQPIYDEVTFDRASSTVELQRKNERVSVAFREIAAIRVRERTFGAKQGSMWYVEIMREKGRAIPFVASRRGWRQAAFDETAPLAKAVCEIISAPVHVCVAGAFWTPGWPPKSVGEA